MVDDGAKVQKTIPKRCVKIRLGVQKYKVRCVKIRATAIFTHPFSTVFRKLLTFALRMHIEETQYGGMLTMALLTLTLAFLLPMRTALGTVFSRARWLMAGSISLLFVQFLLQYTLHFRAMGITQGVFVNLLFFVPCAWQLSLGVLYLLRNGRVTKREWSTGITAYLVMVATLLIGGLMNGHSPLDDTPQMRWAEYAAASIYSIMQFYYCWLNVREFQRIHRALNSYYDHDKSDLLRWMEHSVWLLSLSGLLAPFTIFASGLLLTCYSIFIFLSIYYCVFSFICYGVSNDQQQINMAEDEYLSSEDRERSISEEERLRVERTVAKWVNKGGFKQSGITLQTVSKEINISRYHLTAWLKTTDQELFNPWLTFLRIEEAKRLLTEHPDWSNDTVAQACGFNSRSYFQNVFRKQTGLTPAQFASNTE